MARLHLFADEDDDTDAFDRCGDCGASFDEPHKATCSYVERDELGISSDQEGADFDDPDQDEDLQGLNDLRK